MELLTSRQWRSLYCMFLNTQGRVLFDALIYHGEENVFLLDIDQKCSNLAKKHLSMYKIRRNVAIDLETNYSVYGAFNPDSEVKCPELSTQSSQPGSTFCTPESETSQSQSELKIFPDPRLSALGSRLLLDRSSEISPHLPPHTELVPAETFTQHRLLLGVTEGVEEVPVGKVTPLEYNLDY